MFCICWYQFPHDVIHVLVKEDSWIGFCHLIGRIVSCCYTLKIYPFCWNSILVMFFYLFPNVSCMFHVGVFPWYFYQSFVFHPSSTISLLIIETTYFTVVTQMIISILYMMKNMSLSSDNCCYVLSLSWTHNKSEYFWTLQTTMNSYFCTRSSLTKSPKIS